MQPSEETLDNFAIKIRLKNIETVESSLFDDAIEFSIWPSDELDEFNRGYEVETYLPDYYAIGSNGGLEMVTVHLPSEKIYSIPFIPMETGKKILVAGSLEIFLGSKEE